MFFGLVQVWSASLGEAPPVAQVVGVIVLAQAMPVAALAWMLSSVAGYSVGAGQLVVHRVIFDRAYSLNGLRGVPQLRRGVITLVIGPRELRLRVADPPACLAALHSAAGAGRC
ncbi:hypothetical protein [Opitutus terrae]|uniref:DUF304 domain-containing protein n=1 Tax=Opitutus terrae (strain DSM 11246 / JCM 15787 / PB90-1) TaxID=452637 RepID=B1ZN67_OPITP|nr:hypothetical protein [Opitutus terrae]ACB73436.1 hypothetical protein Oter_0145 [Opitutus terrae PB90-1]